QPPGGERRLDRGHAREERRRHCGPLELLAARRAGYDARAADEAVDRAARASAAARSSAATSRASAGSFVTANPPRPVEIGLLHWVEKNEASAAAPFGRPLYVPPRPWVQSSITTAPCGRAAAVSASRSADRPNVFCASTTRVRGVIAAAT